MISSPKIRLSVVLVLGLSLIMALPATAKKKPKNPDDLFNPMLGPDYAQWLVGPIVEIATAKEVERFLELISDEEAEGFVAQFWEKRNEGTPVFQKTPQQVYDQRVEEADKRYSEGAYPGSRTDRGKVFILYGEPESVEYEAQDRIDDPTLEVWYYPKETPEGLDGEQPDGRYRFIKVDGATFLYSGRNMRRDFRDELKRRRTGWSG
ncbi:MAG: GWxTD domain-containing protein [Thermoanaerobaculia bacterium]|nr:GWxTD domain-containing protein [Thermoanaerobaculia bacterium]